MTDEKSRDPRDVLAGQNIATLRGDMPQAVLAAKMRELGWKWSQATVWAVEKGDRPLRLSEAQDVLALLGRNGIDWTLLRPTPLAQLGVASRRAGEAWEAVVGAMLEFREAQVNLSFAYSQAREEGLDLRNGDLTPVEHWLSRGILDEAIDAANHRWWKAEDGEGDDPMPTLNSLFNGLDSPIWERNVPEEVGSDGVDQEEA